MSTTEAAESDVIVRELFRRILLRDPTAEELADSLRLVRNEDGPVRREDWALLAQSLFATNEFLFLE